MSRPFQWIHQISSCLIKLYSHHTSSVIIRFIHLHHVSSCFLITCFHDFPFFSTSAIILTIFINLHHVSSFFNQQVSLCFNFCFLTVSALRRVPRRLCHRRYHFQGFPTDSCHARNIALKLRRFFLTRLIEDFLQLQRAPHKNTCTQTSANAAPIPPNVCRKAFGGMGAALADVCVHVFLCGAR